MLKTQKKNRCTNETMMNQFGTGRFRHLGSKAQETSIPKYTKAIYNNLIIQCWVSALCRKMT